MPPLLVDSDLDLLTQWQEATNLAARREALLLRRLADWWSRLPLVLRALLLDVGLDAFFDRVDDLLWEESREAQEGIAGDLTDVAALAMSVVPGMPMAAPLVDTATLRAEQWARNQAGALVTSINATQRSAIQALVLDSLEMGVGTTVLADRLMTTSVGMSPQYAVAVDNYLRGLLANGTPRGIARRMADEYAERLRRARMETIARTETQRAMNEGRLALWRAAEANGDLPLNQTVQWLTAEDERVCPFCAPMDAVEVPLGADFDSLSKHGRVEAPPLHPNCRCLVVLTQPRAVERSNLWRVTRDLPPLR